MRQAQALIGAEAVNPWADESRNRFGATARAGLAWTSVLVRWIGIGALRQDMKFAGGTDFQYRNKAEQQNADKERRECWFSHGYHSSHVDEIPRVGQKLLG